MLSIAVSVIASLVTLVGTQKLAAQTRAAQHNKERLQKLYSPLLGHLLVNEELWKSFQDELKKEFPTSTEFISSELFDNKKGEDVISHILRLTHPDKEKGIKLWIGAMEGVFRDNNESTERLILQNFAFLSENDPHQKSLFFEAVLKYLIHVGEFKSLFHRWEKDSRELETGKCTWDSLSMATRPQSQYFHPVNPYPDGFLKLAQDSVRDIEKRIQETWVFFS